MTIADPSTAEQGESAHQPGVLLAGDRFLISMWLSVLVVVARVTLQVVVDYTAEGLRGDGLLEHAYEHVIVASRRCWPLVAVLTLLVRGSGLAAWFRGVLAFATTVLLMVGWPGGEIQYIPSMDSPRGLLGVGLVVLMALAVVAADRWGTSPSRFFYARPPQTRFMITAVVLLLGGAAVLTHKQLVTIQRTFMTVDRTICDLLGEVRGPEAGSGLRRRDVIRQDAERPVAVGSLLPNQDVMETGGGNKPSLLMTPDAEVQVEVGVANDCVFRFSCGVDREGVKRGGEAAVEFRVLVDGQVEFSKTLRPWTDEGDRRWFDGEVELPAREDGVVALTLKTRVEGQLRQPILAGFGRPLIVRSERFHRTKSQDDRLNVVFIVADTLRADHLGTYGYERNTSPEIDRLAAESIVYERAYSPSSWTWPAIASLLTGRHPASHGVLNESRCFLADELVTVSERLQLSLGMTTGGWSANPLITRHKNYQQGFEVWREFHFRPGWFITREFRDFLHRNQKYHFFAFLHYIDPHQPYRPRRTVRKTFARDDDFSVNAGLPDRAMAMARYDAPPPSSDELSRLVDLYDEEILTLDEEVGRVRLALEKAGLWDRTIVIFTADHGEEFMDHGGLTHGWTLFEEQVHVPLMIRDPVHHPGGMRVADPVEITALRDTILHLLGVAEGRTLRPLTPYADAAPRWIFTNTERGIRDGEVEVSMWTVQDERNKLIVAGEDDAVVGFYDLLADPAEQVDRAAESGPMIERMLQALERFRSNQREASSSRPFDQEDPQTLEALEALGYTE